MYRLGKKKKKEAKSRTEWRAAAATTTNQSTKNQTKLNNLHKVNIPIHHNGVESMGNCYRRFLFGPIIDHCSLIAWLYFASCLFFVEVKYQRYPIN